MIRTSSIVPRISHFTKPNVWSLSCRLWWCFCHAKDVGRRILFWQKQNSEKVAGYLFISFHWNPWIWCFKQRCKSLVGLNLFYQIEHMTNTQPNAVSQTQAANIQCRLCNSVTWHHIYNIYTKQGAIFKCQQKTKQ